MVLYVTDKEEYRARSKDIGSEYRRRMGKHYPAMSLVEVKSLLEDGAKVEIEAVAVL
jgi:enamine deaminase RidA (YjgF/YER057c/UK114 family)